MLFVSHDRYFIDGLATRVFEVEDRRVHIYPGNYEDYIFRKSGGIPTNSAEAAALLKTDSATGARIDAATGMLKPVKQVGTKAESAEIPGGTDLDSRSFESGAVHGIGNPDLRVAEEGPGAPAIANGSASTHEIEGSLAPVSPAPRSQVKKLNPIKLRQLESRVAAIEQELPELEARIGAAVEQQAMFTTAEVARTLAAELEALRQEHAARTSEWEALSLQLEEQMTA